MLQPEKGVQIHKQQYEEVAKTLASHGRFFYQVSLNLSQSPRLKYPLFETLLDAVWPASFLRIFYVSLGASRFLISSLQLKGR